ncbi:MAG: T9SS type A sorting domain-containing protein [Crocinitomicaceae bacterium]|nr:T9SS type A sorting domain-containing protein [Crocinitomicaceae bacterium]
MCSLLTAAAQCPVCTPDLSCVSPNNFPAICPQELPSATAGVYYEQNLTFYLPAVVDDPESGFQITLLSVNIASVTGLPYGINYTINDDDQTYHPSDGENYGCATLCGTPVLPGAYTMTITVNVTGVAFGIEGNQVQTFDYALLVEPGAGGTNSFTYNNAAGCGSLSVDFDAVLAGNSAQVTTYVWDFGNGEGSTVAHPPVVVYDTPGDYAVSLNTVIAGLVLQSVYLGTMNSNWDGDVDDFFSAPADPYFTINDGDANLVYTSSFIDNVSTASWQGLSIQLLNPPYTITFWDDDVVSPDDNLGTATLTMSSGTLSFNSGNGTTGTTTVVANVINDITDTSVISVFPIPDPTYVADSNTLTCTDGSLSGYIWMLNGIPIEGESNSSIEMTAGGNYSVLVTNIYGCSATSDEFLFCPSITPIYNAVMDEMLVDENYESYQWYLDGAAVEGATSFYIIDPQNGTYTVEVGTSYGCIIQSEPLDIFIGVEEFQKTNLSIFPNPAGNFLTISRDGQLRLSEYQITHLSGKCLIKGSLEEDQDKLDVSQLPSGVYFLRVSADEEWYRLRFIKE